MIDYSEGYLNLKKLVADLWDALNHGDPGQARVICDCIVVEARLTKAQIGAQQEQNDALP
tara:strand:- start:377 stop:556 length:180 start_codon:yes stop_codon:yes gene_type:complete